MKLIIGNCFNIPKCLGQRVIVVVTHTPKNYISNIDRAKNWLFAQYSDQNSPLHYFVSLSENFELAKSRIHHVNCKNPYDEEEPGKQIQNVSNVPIWLSNFLTFFYRKCKNIK